MADAITVGDGVNVIAGDNADATFAIVANTSVLTNVETLSATDGGADVITAGNGGNVIFGGSGADRITVGSGANVILGDNGRAVFTSGVLTMIESTDGAFGGDDTISGGNGDDVVIGGFGADQIAMGDGSDIILGDSGHAEFDGAGILTTIYSTYGGSAFGAQLVPATGTSSNDRITLGVGNDVVIGGAGADFIILGSGVDVVMGDDGEADYTNGVLTKVWSTDALYGGDDTISGAWSDGVPGYGGSGGSVVIGGIGADRIYLAGDANIVFGDNGELTFNSAGVILAATIINPYDGGDDIINVSGGGNLIFGGAGSDAIAVNVVAGDASGNVILGDDGDATFVNGVLNFVETNTPDVGGNDTITGGDGDNVVLGGSGSDQINLGSGRNLIIGDNGYVTYSAGVVTVLATTSPDSGGDDTIVGGGGDNVVLGGFGADHITLTDGKDLVIGDNGEVDFPLGVMTKAFTTSAAYGGGDTISVSDGNDIVFGGSGADMIRVGEGRNIVLGDNGEVDLQAGVVSLVVTTDATVGGDDNYRRLGGRSGSGRLRRRSDYAERRRRPCHGRQWRGGLYARGDHEGLHNQRGLWRGRRHLGRWRR